MKPTPAPMSRRAWATTNGQVRLPHRPRDAFVDRHGRVNPLAKEAIAKGANVDVGYGSHFSFNMARIALDAGIMPDTLGADMHGYNTTVPKPAGTPDEHPDKDHMFAGTTRFSLVSGMTTMLALGLPLDHVVAMATRNQVFHGAFVAASILYQVSWIVRRFEVIA